MGTFEEQAVLKVVETLVQRMDKMIEKLDRLDYIYMSIRSIENQIENTEQKVGAK